MDLMLRDYIACAALNGLIAQHSEVEYGRIASDANIQANSVIAYKYADAMLLERNKVATPVAEKEGEG